MTTYAPQSKAHDQIRHEQRTNRRMTWLVALSLVGYPLLGTLVALTSLPSLVAAVPVRLAVIFLSLSLLLTVRLTEPLLFSIRRIPMTPVRVALMLFWLIYICRLIWDWQVVQMPEADSALLYLSVVGLPPALALVGVAPRYWDANAFAKVAFFAGAATCAVAVAATLLGLAGERSLMEETGRLAFDTVNSITYGHVAVTTLLAGLVGWSDGASRRPAVLVVVVVGAVAALVCLQLAASKGPILALAVCILALGVFNARFRWVLFAMLPVAAVFLFLAYDGNLGQRFASVEEDPSTINRWALLTNAIAQFLEHPILGNAFVETEMQTYPHNPLVEAAMATGVLGLSLYAFILFNAGLRLLGLFMSKGRTLFALVALQYLVGEHFSGSLYASGGLWLSIAMVIAMTSREEPASSSRVDKSHYVPQASAGQSGLRSEQ